MKKILIIFVLFLSLILILFNSYGGWFDKTVCVDTDAQIRNGIINLPNETESFTGKNLCEYENGQFKLQGKVKDGRKDGKWTKWYANGQIEQEENYNDGTLVNETNFKYSKKVSETKYTYNENGQIKSEEHYKDFRKDGQWTWWYVNGQIRAEATYKDGKCISGDCNKCIVSGDGNVDETGEQIFQNYCTSCHTFGKGILVGPDLAGVTSRREENWLLRQIKEPDVLIKEKDPIALQLLQDFYGMPMVNLGLSDAEVKSIISYFKSLEQQKSNCD